MKKYTVKGWHNDNARMWDNIMYANAIVTKVREDEKREVLRMAMPVKGLKVLDAGTGTGRFASEYLKAGAASLLGVDVAKNMMAEAVKKCKPFRGKYKFREMSVHNVRLPKNSFDFVSCIGVIEHAGDERKAVHQLAKVLRPGGKIVIASANGNYVMRNFVRDYEKKVTGLPKFFQTEKDFEKWFDECGIRLEEVSFCGLSNIKQLAMRIVVKGTKVA